MIIETLPEYLSKLEELKKQKDDWTRMACEHDSSICFYIYLFQENAVVALVKFSVNEPCVLIGRYVKSIISYYRE